MHRKNISLTAKAEVKADLTKKPTAERKMRNYLFPAGRDVKHQLVP